MNSRQIGIFAAVFALLVGSVRANPLRQVVLTAEGYSGSTTLANFPLLVRISPSIIKDFDYTQCATNGADLSFTDMDGNAIPHEVDEWNTDGESLVWVKVPALAGKTTQIKMRWTDSAPPENDPTAVWSGADYKAVWHMNCNDTNQTDSTSTGLKASMSPTATYSLEQGKVGKALKKNVNLTAPDFFLSENGGVNAKGYTVSGWFYGPDIVNSGEIHPFRKGYWNQLGWYFYMKGTYTKFSICYNKTTCQDVGTIPDFRSNWNYVTLTYDNSKIRIYLNGSLGSSGTKSIANLGCGTRPFEMAISGWYDETRVRSAVSSADWIKAEYEQVNSSSYVTAGDIEILDTAVIANVSHGPVPGAVSPDYGIITDPIDGKEYTFTCTEPEHVIVENIERTVCTGWKLYSLSDGSLLRSSSDAGEETLVCKHTYVKDAGVKLVWQWAREYMVTASAEGNGAVDKSAQWIKAGETATVTAIPGAGSQFAGWSGSVSAFTLSCTMNVMEPKVLTAHFIPASTSTIYVSKSGSDSGTGAADSPLLTIEAAIARAPSDGSGATILVGPGTYPATNTVSQADSVVYAIYLNKANVSIISTEGPATTTIDAGTDAARAEAKICATGARMSGFTFKNGYRSNKTRYAGVNVTAGGISNCWLSIRGQWAADFALLKLSSGTRAEDIYVKPTTFGGGEVGPLILVSDATINGLVMTNITYTDVANGSPRTFLSLSGASVLRNALIANNTMGKLNNASLYSFVTINGGSTALVADSTFVNNKSLCNNGVLSIGSDKATVTNCVFWGNTCFSANPDFHGGNNKARVYSSCSAELTANERGNIVVNPQFVDFDNRDYHLKPFSQAKDMGATWLRPSGSISGFVCAADGDTYKSAVGESLEVNFTGYAAGAVGAVTASWNFGDGSSSTDWPTATHTYTAPGAYTVTLTLTDESGNDPVVYTIPTKVCVIPTTCYVKEGSTGEYPYDTWEKATSSLRDAIDVGSRHIIVTNGTYTVPTPQILIQRALSITSVEGPEKTTIKTESTAGINRRLFTLSSSNDILISGLTLFGGYTDGDYYWTATIDMSAGVLTNCVIREKGRISRSTASLFSGSAKVCDCVFDGTSLTTNNDRNDQCGVRLDGSSVVMDRCTIYGYKVATGNSSGYIGESPVSIRNGATLRNSLVYGCTNGTKTAGQYCGVITLLSSGKIVNCTVTGNSTGGYGGGVYARQGTIVNSIIYGNSAKTDGADLYSESATPTVSYTCAGDFSSWKAGAGEGCTVKNPNFEGASTNNYRLTALSTDCLDKGENESVGGDCDLDRKARIVNDVVDLGCYEFAGSTEVPLDGTIDTQTTSGRIPFEVTFEANIVGNTHGLTLEWDFGDGTVEAGELTTTHTYTKCGDYTVKVTARNDKPEEKVITFGQTIVAVPQTCYVSTIGSNESPYDTWDKAARSITAAIALNPRHVIVSNGTYGVSGDGVVISSDIELKSLNGPSVTTINAQTCRNVWLSHTNAVCSGFKLTNGYGDWDSTDVAATIAAGLLTNCVICSFSTYQYRAPLIRVKSKGKVSHCKMDMSGFAGNDNGSNYFGTTLVESGEIENCEICNFSKTSDNGAMSTPRAGLTLTGTAKARNILVRNITLTPPQANGQAMAGVVITGSGTLENCTIVKSKGSYGGAGLTITSGANDTPVVRNCIVVESTAANGASNPHIRDVNSAAAPRVTYSCSPDLTTGVGNVTNGAGIFTAQASKPTYYPHARSVVKDSGLLLDWMTSDATDLQGKPRKSGARPDMGCYENQSQAFMLLVK